MTSGIFCASEFLEIVIVFSLFGPKFRRNFEYLFSKLSLLKPCYNAIATRYGIVTWFQQRQFRE